MTTTNDAPAPAPSGSGVREVATRAKYLLNRGIDDLGIGEIDTLIRMAAALPTDDVVAKLTKERDDAVKAIELCVPVVCGQNSLFPPERVGCGCTILRETDVFRCTDCGTPFHRDCAKAHFGEHPSLASDASPRGEAVTFPGYGKMPFDELGQAVMAARYGNPEPFAFDPEFYPGHQIIGTINFNSLNRIVTWFVERYAHPAPATMDRWQDIATAPNDDRDILVGGWVIRDEDDEASGYEWRQVISSREDRDCRRGYRHRNGARWATLWHPLPRPTALATEARVTLHRSPDRA